MNRRKRQQTPTFLEGTPGLYVKRESPPRVPSTGKKNLNIKNKKFKRQFQRKQTLPLKLHEVLALVKARF